MHTQTEIRRSAEPRRTISAGDHAGNHVDLFLISFLALFAELACIRWFGSTVVFLTFFTNIVLMACFLGLSVGCLAATRQKDHAASVLPLTLISIELGYLVYWIAANFGQIVIDVGGQGSPQEVFFGTESRVNDVGSFVLPIELVAGIFFGLIAMIFVGLGQVMGRAFSAIPNRVAAYTTNVVASLAGILAFGVMSYLRMPPFIWFALIGVTMFRFLRHWTLWQILSLAGVIAFLAIVESRGSINHRFFTIWSPYYQITYYPQNGDLETNHIGHQRMHKIGETGGAYMLPHLLNRDAGGRPFEDVMIIGAGSGNDVAAALAGRVGHVDAVEIEPVLNEIGRDDHPLHPYDDPRVTIHLDDGRSFARKTNKQYDLIEYALVDSLMLHSSYSTLRLESFLFTEQAFQDIKSRLKPDGVFAMCNYYRQGWVVGRLAKMAEEAFGAEPIVISLPYAASIPRGESMGGKFTFVLAGHPGSRTLESIRRALRQNSFFWLSREPRDNEPINGFGEKAPERPGIPADRWERIGMASVETGGLRPLPTDDWPFLYLSAPVIPSLNLRGMAVIAILSVIILQVFAPVRPVRLNGQMFFLGAGFMLLETKGVVHMALLFGSTWVVNSIVFFAILLMILLSNLFTLAFKPRVLWPYYLLLVIALLANVYVPMSDFLNLSRVARIVASCAVVFVPVFFAGVIFAAAFRDSLQPDRDFGSNIGGIILGGLSENLSLMFGFNHMLLVAITFYVLSAMMGSRSRALFKASQNSI
jgi:SAM-dependent methyltransferase